MRQHIPNLLTLLRLVLAAAFFVILEQFRAGEAGGTGVLSAAAVVFVVAAVTDAVDGHLARRWQVESTFGRIMDPLADKVLVLGAFVYLAGPRFFDPAVGQISGVYPWMVVVILTRELLVTAIRGQIEALGVKFGAVRAGKLKMIFQTIVVPAVLLLAALADLTETSWATITRDVLVWATVAATIASGVPYVTNAARALKERGDEAAE
jgi:CDP-diacylglycerol--glycerol-3-phosphate 3-phosphatidyltransferase